MIYPGEYPQPLDRVTNVMCPIVGGYVTARLRVDGDPTISTSGYANNTTLVTVENVGANPMTIRLQGSNDYISGPKEWLGGTATLVPRGHTAYAVVPRHTYLEVFGQSGTSQLRMQLASRLRWTEMGFARNDPFYPPSLFTAKSPLTSAV